MESEHNSGKRSSIKQLRDDFAGYSTLHGLHFLFDSSCYFRKLAWLFLLLGAASFFFYLAVSGWEKWKKNEVFITTEIKVNDVSTLPFPSVTICNMNTMKKSKILGTDSQRYLDAMDESLRRQWPAIYSQMNQSSFNIEQAVLENGHQIDDMVKSCSFGLYRRPCDFKHTFDFKYGLCHIFNSNGTFKILKRGATFGLSLLLDAEPEEYYGRFSRNGVGFSIMIHDSNSIPTPEFDAYDVPPGFATNFILKRKEIIRQPAPYPSKCGGIQLKSSNVYTDDLCFLEKYTKDVVDQCDCRILGMSIPGEKNGRLCTVQEITSCVFPILYLKKFDPEECPPPCNTVQYDIKTSFLVFPSGNVLEIVSDDIKKMYESSNNATNTSYHDWYRSRFALVNIFFNSPDTEVVREVPAYEFVDFLASFGGNMGLLLGCSVLTLCEFIDLFVLVVIEWYRKKRSRKIKTVSPLGERFSVQDKHL